MGPREWELESALAECSGDDMNFGFQFSLKTCAAICHLKSGNMFSYGVEGGETCTGACVCKCWTKCTSTRPTTEFNLFKFIQQYNVKELKDGKKGM